MPKLRTLAAAALAVTLAAAPIAHADLKVVQSTTIKNPQLTAMIQSMTPEQRANVAQMGGGLFMSGAPITTTIYSRAGKARVDVGAQTTITDLAEHKIITINRTTHTYSIAPYSPNQAGQVQASVRDTGQTRTILGHPARRYAVSLTSTQLQGGRIAGDIWSAQDIAQPPAASLFTSGPAAALQGQFRKVKGMPLLVNMLVTGSPVGDTTVHSVTKSISRATLPASLFTVPAGFTRTEAAPAPTPGG